MREEYRRRCSKEGKGLGLIKGTDHSCTQGTKVGMQHVFCCLTGWPAAPPPPRIPMTQAPPPPLPPFQWPPFSRPLPSGPRPPPVLSAGSYLLCCMRVAQARNVCRRLPPSSSPHPSTNVVKGRPSGTRIRYLPSVVEWREPAPMPSSFQRGPPNTQKCWFL
jgi:hypothetical protein